MIYVGIDDTDIQGSAGTNQLARRISADLPQEFQLQVVLRHQLLRDARVPYTSQNGSASIGVRADAAVLNRLLPVLRGHMQAWYVAGSDPGLCVAAGEISQQIVDFGRRCQREVVTQSEARALANRCAITLEDFGGTGDGVIGALAAVGLLAEGNDGRVVHLPTWTWPDAFGGCHPADALFRRGVDEIRRYSTGELVTDGVVDVGKHLRPAYRARRVVLYVEPGPTASDGTPSPAAWQAVKLP